MKKKVIIFKKDNKYKEIVTIRYGTIPYYIYLHLIQIEMKRHKINTIIQDLPSDIYLYKII